MKKLIGLLALVGLLVLPQVAQAKFFGDDLDNGNNGQHLGWTQGKHLGQTKHAAPEPVSTVLFIAGGAALAAFSRKKKS